MPVALEWHPSLPVLLATYSGDLSPKDYKAMLDQRRRMIADGPEEIILVADARDFSGFSEADIKLGENILGHDKVAHAFVILHEEAHLNLHRTFRKDLTQDYRVYFFDGVDQALTAAQTRLG
jgi:hypothetical protein